MQESFIQLIDVLVNVGSKILNLGSDMHKKLKATYTLIEQLYTGTQRAISTTAHKKQPPTLIKDTLEKLSVLPQQVEELKKSAARADAIIFQLRASGTNFASPL